MKVCQINMLAVYESYGEKTLEIVSKLLTSLRNAGFDGVHFIALWQDGGHGNGFDIIEYDVNPRFGSIMGFRILMHLAHLHGLKVGVDVVTSHVSDRHLLAQKCLNGVSGYEDCLYVATKEDHQSILNWNSKEVRKYFRRIFRGLENDGIDFVKVHCSMDPANSMVCFDPQAHIEPVREVADDMPLFFDWFDLTNVDLFNGLDNCWALDCSHVLTGKVNTNWSHEKLIPLLGGHGQMTLADRGMNISEVMAEALKSKHIFSDMQTELSWTTKAEIMLGDGKYEMKSIIETFIKKFG